MIASNDNQLLELSYSCNTNRVTYSIADFDGNVLKRGDYCCLENKKLAIDDLPKGIYLLCIIDGDALNKARFQKN
jgi:hypothetical protein